MNKLGNGNNYEIRYHYLVVKKDISNLSESNKIRVKFSIEQKLTEQPEVFGKPLRKSLSGYRKLRVGDYRIIFKIKNKIVFILLIEHRSIVYKEILNRI